jgi:hypothetical protein
VGRDQLLSIKISRPTHGRNQTIITATASLLVTAVKVRGANNLHVLPPILIHNHQGHPIATVNLPGRAVVEVIQHHQIQEAAEAILPLPDRAAADHIPHLHDQAVAPVHHLRIQAVEVQVVEAGAGENSSNKNQFNVDFLIHSV